MKKLFPYLFLLALAGLYFACNSGGPDQNNSSDSGGEKAVDYASFDGTYVSDKNNEEFNGQLMLTFAGNNTIAFEISNGSADGCAGMLKGEAAVENEGTATYSGDRCKTLTFHLMEGKVHVMEEECDGWHGVGCPFEGTYVKQ